MKTFSSIRKIVDASGLEHRMFCEHRDALCRIVDDTLAGHTPSIEWIVGPSRAGKTYLIETLVRLYPEAKLMGVRRLPVLLAKLPSTVTPLMLPMTVLNALGVPAGSKSSQYFSRMKDQLRLAQTRVLLVEEASHIVEPGAKVIPRAAGDWFKMVYDELEITIMMFGLPRLKRLFESNEQLRGRASAKRELRPYDCNVKQDLLEFASYVRTYLEFFRNEGWTCEVPLDALAKNCYLLGGGLVGLVSKLMRQLASQISHQPIRALALEDFAIAAEAIEHFAPVGCAPFSKMVVEPVELNQAHRHILNVNGMSVRFSELLVPDPATS